MHHLVYPENGSSCQERHESAEVQIEATTRIYTTK
jgi:hypothetical protein